MNRSGVALALETQAALHDGEGIRTPAVSMPCWGRPRHSSGEYRESVLPPGMPAVSVEAGVSQGLAPLGPRVRGA